MKPAPFEYRAPTSIEEALDYLSEYGSDAKVLAGGQSLIPMMNFRLTQPSILIDLNKIVELSYIHPDKNSGLRLGAMTRYYLIEQNPLVAEQVPLLHDVMPHIATPQIRSRGTIGGSLAHADPAAQLVTVSVALDWRFQLRSRSGERWVPANEFYVGMFTTLLEPDELLVDIALPPIAPRTGWAFLEVARRAHDFALVGVAAVVTLDERDQCKRARLVFLSVGDGPVEACQATEMLNGHAFNSEIIRAAAETAAIDDVDPSSDIHATAEYRRHLVEVLARRALEQTFDRALSAK